MSSALVSRLARENTGPASLVLVAGFSSIPNLLATYRLATVIPIVEPLYHLPGVKDLVYRILHTKFDTQSVIRVREPGSLGLGVVLKCRLAGHCMPDFARSRRQ